MSHEDDKIHHSERLHQKETKIQRQINIAKNYHMHKNGRWRYIEQPHRNHKTAILNCGDPRCYMCMNPRRANGERTMQERRFDQSRLHEEVLDNKDEV
jgi:hypothetical protein